MAPQAALPGHFLFFQAVTLTGLRYYEIKKVNDLSSFCIPDFLCYPFENPNLEFLFLNKEVDEKN
ncbi:hypothetical protein [Bdellovibrio bacteriovorus]|uniref:hypothetical protein n=1 Tax=Bdellovibrio bacteriovorus TaxID=959 RepID=UPI003AA9426B